ncbi:MAG: RNA methyltransferase [Bacteroidetes bacterium]|nr:RNA methyltransferase [Bacteroidota bacterium]
MLTKAEIALIKSLDKKRERQKNNLFFVEGEKLTIELLESRAKLKKLFYVNGAVSQELLSLARHKKVEIESVSNSEMGRISHLKTSTPVLLLAEISNFKLDEKVVLNGLTIALDGIQDPGNLGTIIRLADWFGIKNIICSLATVDVYNPKVIQATMGAITRVKVHYVDLKDTLSYFKKKGSKLYITALDGEDMTSKKCENEGAIIIMGNEGKGVSEDINNLADDRLFIPSFPKERQTTESLNVGVATAILCYHFRFNEVVK